VLVHSLVQQATQTGILNTTTKTNNKKQHFQRSTQKVYVGPHFWLTKHYLNMVRKVGVLQWSLFILYVLNPCASIANMLTWYQLGVHQFSYFDWVTSLKLQLTYLVLYYTDASINNACIFICHHSLKCLSHLYLII
jgi:hypothetical protein